MYDTINMRLNKENIKGIDLISHVPKKLNNLSEHYHKEGESLVIIGNFGGFKVSVTEKRVTISEHSLSKWYLGDNFQTLTRGDTQRAIEKLSDELCLPIHKADLTRIDLAQNFIMTYEVPVYFSHLGLLQYYNRFEQAHSLYYLNQKRQLVFYNKVREYIDKGLQVPVLFRDKNTLRFEMRFKNRLSEQFNLPEVKAFHLFNETFYMKIIDRWYQEYKNINKTRDAIKFDYAMIKTKKQYQLQAILFYVLQKGGEVEALKEITEAKKRGELSKKQAYDLKEQIKEACKCELITSKSDIISELDRKIKESVRFYN